MSKKDHFLLAILLSQILVESLFLFMPTIESQRFAYFALDKYLRIGLIPSLVIWVYSDSVYSKSLSLTLVIFNSLMILVEIIARVSGCELIVETLNLSTSVKIL